VDLARPIVGFVGRLVREKGIMDLIEALQGTGASLLVVGDGPMRARAEARAADLRARFIGPVEHADVPAWYASMDIVAIPSRATETWKEQFGRVVIESNAASVPVVVSDSGELPATVAATGGGLVVPEGDVGALAHALGALASDPARRAELGTAGATAVAARFTPQAVAAELAAFLKDVAA
jgi:glycosyltransferase involved in cell wall biosynthesis